MRFDFLANILFPPACLACRKRIASGVICKDCLAGISIRDSLIADPALPYILGAAGYYEDKTLQSLIHHLKFRSIKGAAEPLAELMARYATTMLSTANLDLANFVVIPIPLSRRRLRTRGYNQAALIARCFAEKLKNIADIDLQVMTNILIRAKHTKPQSETVSEAERHENIRGAFTVADSPTVRGANGDGGKILLIDDVATTGSTFLEASLALKAAGAKTIIALAAAKT